MRTKLGALLAVAVISPALAVSETCPTDISCPAGNNPCLTPGTVFLREKHWKPIVREKIHPSPARADFFYVVDGTKLSRKYDTIFVAIDKVGRQTAQSKVKLTQNREFDFTATEEKQKYTQSLKPDGAPTQSMRRWAYLPDIGSMFLVKKGIVPDFDIPQATQNPRHDPHARFYRFATGNISCIPFDVDIDSGTHRLLGKIIDSSKTPLRRVIFEIEFAVE